MLNNAYYNLEGLGIQFVASPRHADLLLVTGPVSRNMETALRRTYDAIARSEARRRGRRLRLHRRHLRRELRELRPGVERDPGRRRRARLPADADGAHAGHPHRDQRWYDAAAVTFVESLQPALGRPGNWGEALSSYFR